MKLNKRVVIAGVVAAVAFAFAMAIPTDSDRQSSPSVPASNRPSTAFQFPVQIPVAGIPVFNVQSFGATGNGSTDDRVAITSAMTSACGVGGGIVFFPAGTYRVTRTGSQAYCLVLPCGNLTLLGLAGQSWIQEQTGMSQVSLLEVDALNAVTIRDLGFDGNWGNAVTTVAQTSTSTSLPQSTINVVSTTGAFALSSAFPAGANTLQVQSTAGTQSVSCTGSTATTFTGCTGGTGTIMRGYGVGLHGENAGINQTFQADPQNELLFIRGATNLVVDGAKFRQPYGDCIWLGANNVDHTKWPTNIRIHNITCDMAARDGVTLGSAAIGVDIDHAYFSNIRQGAIFAQPFSYPVRDVQVQASYLGGWWDPSQNGGSIAISADGNGTNGGYSGLGATVRNWRVHDNTIEGAALFASVFDFSFERNHSVVDWSTSGSANIKIELGGGDIRINGNWMYNRATQSGVEGNGDTADVTVQNYGAGTDGNGNTIGFNPSRLQILQNTIQARNGHHGIMLLSPGGSIGETTGTATAVGSTSLTDSTATWATNQFDGFTVRIGSATAVISSNTSTVLTLTLVDNSVTTGWQTYYGNYAPTPSTGTYVIHRATGTVEVAGNDIDLRDDGNGAGGKGIFLTATTNNLQGMRARIHHNKIQDAATDGIYVHFFAGTTYALLDITDNFGWDDQASPTFANLITVAGTPNITKWVMGRNVLGENVTNAISGLSSGAWLISDGAVQDWAGYGSPESAVAAPEGSTYHRLDGGASTTSYAKTTGTGNTGWTPSSSGQPSWEPQLLLVGSSMDGATPGGTATLTAGQMYMQKVRVSATSFSKVLFDLTTGGALTHFYIAVYKADGTRSSSMATATYDAAALVAGPGVGIETATLTNPVTGLNIGDDVYVALLPVGLGVTLRSGSGDVANADLTASQGFRVGFSGTGLSSVPSSVTLSAMTAINSALWVGVR